MSKVFYPITLLIIILSSVALAQTDKEKKIGEQTHALLVKTEGIYQDDKLLQVVKDVGTTLEKHLTLGYPLTYYLVDTPEPNAFATAGGYVYVTRGLLALINNKDELAGILAHELSHVTEKHVAKKMKASILPLILQVPGNLVGALSSEHLGDLINLPLKATSKIGISAFSRSQERDADKLGIALAIKAGYNPSGLIVALDRLNQYIEFLTGKVAKKNILLDHPLTSERTAYLTEILRARGVQKESLPSGTDIIPQEGLVFGENPSGGVVDGSVFMHPTLKLYCKFPEKWNIENSAALLTALREDEKSTIMVAVEDSEGPLFETGKKLLEGLKSQEIIYQKDTIINGKPAFRAAIRNKKSRFSEQRTEIMLIKIPASNLLIKAVGISEVKGIDKDIVTCFNSFREMTEEESGSIKTIRLTLTALHEWKDIEGAAANAVEKDTYLDLLCILNGIEKNQGIPKTNYFKVLNSTSY